MTEAEVPLPLGNREEITSSHPPLFQTHSAEEHSVLEVDEKTFSQNNKSADRTPLPWRKV